MVHIFFCIDSNLHRAVNTFAGERFLLSFAKARRSIFGLLHLLFLLLSLLLLYLQSNGCRCNGN